MHLLVLRIYGPNRLRRRLQDLSRSALETCASFTADSMIRFDSTPPADTFRVQPPASSGPLQIPQRGWDPNLKTRPSPFTTQPTTHVDKVEPLLRPQC